MSTIAVNAITDASGGTTASINGYTPTASNMAGKNRIINGAMMIDQRNAGASVTPSTGEYALDRWECRLSAASKYSVQQSTDVPAGFTNSMLCTSLSAYSVGAGDTFYINQKIEGYNIADLGWGTANAKTVTLSFWVRSSLTGTFGGSLRNSAANRSYPFSYSISAADTWEQKSITIAGDTTGTWLSDNSTGFRLSFGLGVGSTYSGSAGAWSATQYHSATGATSVVGTSGATFYITGVQLEEGSVATPFENRLYPQELALCQRYYQKSFNIETAPYQPIANYVSRQLTQLTTTEIRGTIYLPVPMRAQGTFVPYRTDINATNGRWSIYNGSWSDTPVGLYSFNLASFTVTMTFSGSYGQGWNVLGHWTLSAEL